MSDTPTTTLTPVAQASSSSLSKSASKQDIVLETARPSSSISANRVYVPILKLYGTLRYLGEIHIRPGVWAGIELETEGAGKNDGSIEGRAYFQCAPKTGIFIPSKGFEFVNAVNKLSTIPTSSDGKMTPPISLASPATKSQRTSLIPVPMSTRPQTSSFGNTDVSTIKIRPTSTPLLPKKLSIASTPPSISLQRKNSIYSPKKSSKSLSTSSHGVKTEPLSSPETQETLFNENLNPISPPVPHEKIEPKLKRLTLTVAPNEFNDHSSRPPSSGEKTDTSESNYSTESNLTQIPNLLPSLPSPMETPIPLNYDLKRNRSFTFHPDKQNFSLPFNEIPTVKFQDDSGLRPNDSNLETPRSSAPPQLNVSNDFKLNNLQMQLDVVQSDLELKKKQYRDLQDRYENLQNDYAVVLNEVKEVKFLLSVAEDAHRECRPKQMEQEKCMEELKKSVESKDIEIVQLKAKLKASKAGRMQAMANYADSIEILMCDLRQLQAKYDDLVKQTKQLDNDSITSRNNSTLSLVSEKEPASNPS